MRGLAEAKSPFRHPNRLLNASGSHYGVTPEEHKHSAKILREDPNFAALMARLKDPNASTDEKKEALDRAWNIHNDAWMYPKGDTRTKLTPG